MGKHCFFVFTNSFDKLCLSFTVLRLTLKLTFKHIKVSALYVHNIALKLFDYFMNNVTCVQDDLYV